MNIIKLKETIYTMRANVVIAKKCDVCGKEIPKSESVCGREYPFFSITTHHNDWGNDSIDSYEYFHACSSECATKFAQEYLGKCFNGINTCTIEIKHKRGWGYGRDEVEQE